MGTGTKVVIVGIINNEILESHTIVIFGDVNGDGKIDATDSDTCVDVQNWTMNWNHDTQWYCYKAGDVNINSIDADIMSEVANYRMHIDQTTGLVVMN